MTTAELETAVREQYNAISDTFFSQASILNLITKGSMELAAKALIIEGKDASTSTVASTRNYNFPTNAILVKRLEYDGSKLKYVDFRDDDLVNANVLSTVTGTPAYYSIWNDVVYLRPTPAAVATLTFYTYNQPAAAAIGTTLSVPARFHWALVDFCLRELCAKDENHNMAAHYNNLWQQHVKDAIAFKAKQKRADGMAAVKDDELTQGTVLGPR